MSRIAAAFGAAADYDAHARVQRIVAERLADAIMDLPLPPAPRVLEIGCGTGFLTRALAARGLAGEWLVTDISPEMVERCRAALGGRPDTMFAVLDGEHGTPPGAGSFDLVCSSLALQWFADPAAGIARIASWLAPGGQALLTTLAAGTFAEWRTAHAAMGEIAGTPDWPDADTIAAMLPAGAAPVRIDRLVDAHTDAAAFLRGLRGIGAHRTLSNRRPLGPAALRRVMDAFGGRVTYEVATLQFGRES